MDVSRRPRLNRAEDLRLRRLAVLRRFGLVAGRLSDEYDELRVRDRRARVREPLEDGGATPPSSIDDGDRSGARLSRSA